MAKERAKRATTARRPKVMRLRRSRVAAPPLRPLSEEVLVDSAEVAYLPGAVPAEEPVPAPHQDEEPGGVPSETLFSRGGYQSDAEEDLHARWQEWEEDHARKKTHLALVVVLTMVGIVGVWLLQVSDSVRNFSLATAQAEEARDGFLENISRAGQRLDAYTASVLATSTPAEAPPAAPDPFLEALKEKASAKGAEPNAKKQ